MAGMEDRDLMPPPPPPFQNRSRQSTTNGSFVLPPLQGAPNPNGLGPLAQPGTSQQAVMEPRRPLYEHDTLYHKNRRRATPSPPLPNIESISQLTAEMHLGSNDNQRSSEERMEWSSSGMQLDPNRNDDRVLIEEPANDQNSNAAPGEEGSSSSVGTPRYMSVNDQQFATYWMNRAAPDRLLPKTPAVPVESSSDAEHFFLNKLRGKQDVAVIRKPVSTFNLDLTPFSSQSILEAARPHFFVQLRRQPLQPPTVNLDGMGKPTWRCRMTYKDSTLYDFMSYQAASFLESGKTEGQDNDDPQPSTSAAAAANIKTRKIVDYAPNLNLSDDEMWSSQLEQLNKLPPCIRINSEGNLLSHIGFKVPGVNTPQMCLMVAGSRVPACQADFFTVNLNIGSGDCEWFAVPCKYWKTLAALCGTKGVKYLHEFWWPVIEDLRNAGIPVYKFVQQPGQLVLIKSGVVYWYQALGICNNISWNVGPPTAFQMQASMERYKLNKIENIRSITPMARLAWNLARNLNVAYDREFFMCIKVAILEFIQDCRYALALAEKENIRMIIERRDENGPVHYCTECSAELFNTFFRYKSETNGKKRARKIEQEKVYCFRCAEKKESLRELVLVQELEMEEVMTVYEGFTFRQ